jgi:hypothetical protein
VTPAEQAAFRADHDALIAEIEALEQRAHRYGCSAAGQFLNRAKNAVGWYMADKLGTATEETK